MIWPILCLHNPLPRKRVLYLLGTAAHQSELKAHIVPVSLRAWVMLLYSSSTCFLYLSKRGICFPNESPAINWTHGFYTHRTFFSCSGWMYSKYVHVKRLKEFFSQRFCFLNLDLFSESSREQKVHYTMYFFVRVIVRTIFGICDG